MEDVIKNNRTASYYIWISVLLATVVLGVYAVLVSFIEGMEVLEFNLSIPWSMMISTYVFFVVSSTGLCIVTSLGHVFGAKRFEMIGKRGVFLAIITIVFGMIAIILHLGHPERSAVYVWITPNIRSAIWGMGFFYSFYILFIMVEYWLLAREELAKTANASTGWKQVFYGLATFGIKSESEESVKRDHKLAQVAGIAALIAGLSAHSTLGAVFGHAESRAYWYGAYYPVYFLLSATFSGLAWLLLMTIATYKLKGETMTAKLEKLMFEMAGLLAVLLSVGLLFMSYKVGTGLLDSIKAKTMILLVNGPFSISFWVFEITIGTVVPIITALISVKRKSLNGILASSIMVIIGLFMMRYDFVIAGQIYPTFRVALPQTFVPTLMEIFVIAGVFGGFFLSYMLALKLLPLKENSH
jgi:molybdopterin-containing oxidoreductase family membrane subunit